MIDKNLFRINRIKPVLIGLAGLAVLQALLIIGQAYFLSKGISQLWKGATVVSQLAPIFIFFACFMGRQLINWLRDKALDDYAYNQSELIRQQLMTKLFNLGPQFIQKEGTGNTVTTAIEGISQVENYLHIILPKITNMMVVPWVVLIFVLTQDIRSGVVLFLVFPIIIIFMIVLGYAARAKADKQYEGFQILSNHFIDSLRGLETLNLLGLSKRYGKNVYQVSENYRLATMGTLKIAILSTFALDFFTTLSIAVIALFLGLRLINGEMPLFPALTVLILAPDFFLPIRDFANDYHATLNGGNTLKSIFAILDKENPLEQQADSSLPLFQANSELVLNQLSVQYQAGKSDLALDKIDFNWQGFGKIGIIGLSGSGKSTLIKVLGGFLPGTDKQAIHMDGIDCQHLMHPDWQKQLAYIPQDPYIFHDTLRYNIAFYVPEATEEEVHLALEKAGLGELVHSLPDGLDTVIGEGGQMLSGGQLQRVALARAFLDQSRRILLFDEPTAHLDVETEAELKATMLPLFDQRLVFFATHRLHWMKEMDYILVLDHGKLVEQGTYEELSQKEGYYQAFVRKIRGEV